MSTPLLNKKRLVVTFNPSKQNILCSHISDLSKVPRNAYIHPETTSDMPIPQAITSFGRQSNGRLYKTCVQYFVLNSTELAKLNKCKISMMGNYILTIIRTNDDHFDTKVEDEGRIKLRCKEKIKPFAAFVCVVYIYKYRNEDNDVRGRCKIRFKYIR